MFQNIANKIDSELKFEVLDAQENKQVYEDEQSEYSEENSECSYESSFVTDCSEDEGSEK